MTFFRGFAPYILSIMRILAAGSFFTHGTMKLFAWPGPFEYPLNPLLYTAGFLKVAGGFLLLIGLLSRPIAVVLSGSMAVAYFMVHFSGPASNHRLELGAKGYELGESLAWLYQVTHTTGGDFGRVRPTGLGNMQ